jgi:hypothetical protein
MTADLVAGAALVPVAVLSLRLVREPRQIPFAALPAVFATHQLIESLVWGGHDGRVGSDLAHAAAVAYVLIALPLLPALVPVAVLLVAPAERRRPMLPFVVLGMVVAGYLAYSVLDGMVGVVPHEHALEYDIGVTNGLVWAWLYVIAVIGPPLLSGTRYVVAFGVVNLIGLIVVAFAYVEAFASLWCVYAALSSVLVLAQLHQRRPVAVR